MQSNSSSQLKNLCIRKAVIVDLPAIEEVYKVARETMNNEGNPTQWRNSHPTRDFLTENIKKGLQYVILSDSLICASFALIMDGDSNYIDINGKWLDNSPYIAIHALGSNGKIHNVFHLVVAFALKNGNHLRIDTHKNNAIMLHLLDKEGFIPTGICILRDYDNSERLTFEYTKDKK